MPPNRTGMFPDPTPVQPERTGLNAWLHTHPYTTFLLGAISLMFLGTIVVGSRLGTTPTGNRTTWGDSSAILLGGTRNSNGSQGVSAADLVKQQAQDSFSFTPLTQPNPDTSADTGEDYDFASLIQQITSGPQAPTEKPGEEAYSYLPTGLISTPKEQQLSVRPGKQNDIAEYGNSVGLWIRGFDESHTNTPIILRDHGEDREDSSKAELVARLGREYQILASEIAGLQRVPESFTGAHNAYAVSLTSVGEALEAVAKTNTDEDFLKAIEVYNAKVEESSKRFQSLSSLFVLNNVHFSASEPGSVFMFNPSLTLSQ